MCPTTTAMPAMEAPALPSSHSPSRQESTPLRISPTKVSSDAFAPMTRKTFVVPVDLEPLERMSTLL